MTIKGSIRVAPPVSLVRQGVNRIDTQLRGNRMAKDLGRLHWCAMVARRLERRARARLVSISSSSSSVRQGSSIFIELDKLELGSLLSRFTGTSFTAPSFTRKSFSARGRASRHGEELHKMSYGDHGDELHKKS
ncbi:hypothetical protein CRG98_001950 [Punica granatum]|uniref:Uncharacterized protein n=1 Tax=Punica granatum TaxID=22663 RepID=A0A2I0LAF7_PUNGR|nr:hypothetical protein CRG98_001950 [Punica granatum]